MLCHIIGDVVQILLRIGYQQQQDEIEEIYDVSVKSDENQMTRHGQTHQLIWLPYSLPQTEKRMVV